jgi:proline iminopeptidase
VREKATLDWCAWEDALLAGEELGQSGPFMSEPLQHQLALVRMCAHYFSHRAFLEDGALIRDAGRLAGIPGVIVHGRTDMGGPVEFPWELSRAWPGSELKVVEDSGHLGSQTWIGHVREAISRFGGR